MFVKLVFLCTGIDDRINRGVVSMNQCQLCEKEKQYSFKHKAQTFHGDEILICNECYDDIMQVDPLIPQEEIDRLLTCSLVEGVAVESIKQLFECHECNQVFEDDEEGEYPICPNCKNEDEKEAILPE